MDVKSALRRLVVPRPAALDQATTWAVGTGPEPLPPERGGADRSGIGICCSGGGIRSAAYNLGALQALSAKGIYQEADFVSCVSGGSYIAASFASVSHGPEFAGERDVVRPAGADYAYSPGSAEEQHLRNHSHYLLPRLAVTVRGFVALMFGVLANLGLLLVFVFIGARMVGWLLHAAGITPGLGGPDPRLRLPLLWWVVPPALLVLGLASLFLDSVIEVYGKPTTDATGALRGGAIKLMVLSLVAGIVMLAVPAAVVGTERLALGNRPNAAAATVLAGLGFGTPEGCAAAAKGSARGACGAPHRDPAEATANAQKTDSGSPLTLAAFLAALVAMIRRVVRLAGGELGPLGTKPAPGTSPDPGLPGLLRKAESRLMPWLGSALVVAAVALLTVRWTGDASMAGLGGSEWGLAGGAVALFLGIKSFTDINRTSMHRYYRERLASAFTIRRVRKDGRDFAEPVPYDQPLSLAAVAPGRNGVQGPELIICAAANITDESVPPGRGCVPFTFTTREIGLASPPPAFAGGERRARLPVEEYEAATGKRRPTLPGAVAISGAAISPLAGKATRPSQRLLLAVANVRLGMWLRNPLYCAAPARQTTQPSWWRRLVDQWKQPGPRLLLLELVGRTHLNRRWLYVTDGGHYDNSGLVEALRRRPTTVFAFDASGDPVDQWSTIGGAISLARTELGAHVEITPGDMQPLDGQRVRVPFARGNIWYAPVDLDRPPDAMLWLTKLGVPEGAPWDVCAYARQSPSFPTDGTLNQLYGADQLEAYRALGDYSTQQMLTRYLAERESAREAGTTRPHIDPLDLTVAA
ncbi:MAG: hypothetical protein V7603_551 [Micromonosporaceae bacterium]